MEVEPGRGRVDAEIREGSFLAQTLGSNPTEGWGGSSALLGFSTGVERGEGARPAPGSADPRGSARVQLVPLHSPGEGIWLQPAFAASSPFYTSSKTRAPGNDPASLKQSRLPPQCFPSCRFCLGSSGSLPMKLLLIVQGPAGRPILTPPHKLPISPIDVGWPTRVQLADGGICALIRDDRVHPWNVCGVEFTPKGAGKENATAACGADELSALSSLPPKGTVTGLLRGKLPLLKRAKRSRSSSVPEDWGRGACGAAICEGTRRCLTMEGEQHLSCPFLHSTSWTAIPLGGLLWEVGLFICFRGGSCRRLGAELSSRSCCFKERSPRLHACPTWPGAEYKGAAGGEDAWKYGFLLLNRNLTCLWRLGTRCNARGR